MDTVVSVYKITNNANGKVYVGITTKSIEQRWIKHQRDARHQNRNTQLVLAINKYGADQFNIEQLAVAETWEEACSLEMRFIRELDSKDNGYNMTDGGDGHKGFKHSDKTVSQMRIAHTGKRHSDETKAKCSESKKGALNPNFGKVYTEEERRRLSVAHSGSRNPNSLTYEVTLPDQSKVVTEDRSGFYKEHNLNYWSVADACRNGRPYKGYFFSRVKSDGREQTEGTE